MLKQINYLAKNINSPIRDSARDKNKNALQVLRGAGSHIFLKNKPNQKIIDFVMGYGCLPFGHAFPPLIKFLQKKIKDGSSFGITNTEELKLAKNIINAFKLSKNFKIRLVNSGSDAANLSVNLTQKITGKQKIIKFKECYHGWGQTFFDKNTILEAKFNDISSVETLIKKHKNKIAALILEPVCANNGLILPTNNFLKKVEEICKKEKIIFIADEVLTAFRLHFGGAFQYFNIKPNLILLGKTLSQGHPFGAVIGENDILKHLAPNGSFYHAGTFNGNLFACNIANFTLEYFKKNYNKLEKKAIYLKKFPNIASAGTIFWIKSKNNKEYKKLYLKLLEKNIFISPSRNEVSFLSIKHKKNDLNFLKNI